MRSAAEHRVRLNSGRVIAIVAWLTHAACSGTPLNPSSSVLPGTWGGDHLTMTVASDNTHFEFDCAHGDVATALALDSHGQFSQTGVFVREHGGPIRQGEVP